MLSVSHLFFCGYLPRENVSIGRKTNNFITISAEADLFSKLLSHNTVFKYKYIFHLHFDLGATPPLSSDGYLREKKRLSSKIPVYFVCHFKNTIPTVTMTFYMTILFKVPNAKVHVFVWVSVYRLQAFTDDSLTCHKNSCPTMPDL